MVVAPIPSPSSPPGHGIKSRSCEEIAYAILAAIDSKGGATKMQIMADVFISHSVATDYLNKLAKEGLVEYHTDTNNYRIREKGR